MFGGFIQESSDFHILTWSQELLTAQKKKKKATQNKQSKANVNR